MKKVDKWSSINVVVKRLAATYVKSWDEERERETLQYRCTYTQEEQRLSLCYGTSLSTSTE